MVNQRESFKEQKKRLEGEQKKIEYVKNCIQSKRKLKSHRSPLLPCDLDKLNDLVLGFKPSIAEKRQTKLNRSLKYGTRTYCISWPIQAAHIETHKIREKIKSAHNDRNRVLIQAVQHELGVKFNTTDEILHHSYL